MPQPPLRRPPTRPDGRSQLSAPFPGRSPRPPWWSSGPECQAGESGPAPPPAGLGSGRTMRGWSGECPRRQGDGRRPRSMARRGWRPPRRLFSRGSLLSSHPSAVHWIRSSLKTSAETDLPPACSMPVQSPQGFCPAFLVARAWLPAGVVQQALGVPSRTEAKTVLMVTYCWPRRASQELGSAPSVRSESSSNLQDRG